MLHLDGRLAQPNPERSEGQLAEVAVGLTVDPRHTEEQVDAPQGAVDVLGHVGHARPGRPAGDGHDGPPQGRHGLDLADVAGHRTDGQVLLEVGEGVQGVLVVVRLVVVEGGVGPPEDFEGLAQVGVVVAGREQNALVKQGLAGVEGLVELELLGLERLEDPRQLLALAGPHVVAFAAVDSHRPPVHELHVEADAVRAQRLQVGQIVGVQVAAPGPGADLLNGPVIHVDDDHLGLLNRRRHQAGVQVQDLQFELAGDAEERQKGHQGDDAHREGHLDPVARGFHGP